MQVCSLHHASQSGGGGGGAEEVTFVSGSDSERQLAQPTHMPVASLQVKSLHHVAQGPAALKLSDWRSRTRGSQIMAQQETRSRTCASEASGGHRRQHAVFQTYFLPTTTSRYFGLIATVSVLDPERRGHRRGRCRVGGGRGRWAGRA